MNGDQWTEGRAVIKTGSICFPPTIVASVKGLYPTVKVSCILLNEDL